MTTNVIGVERIGRPACRAPGVVRPVRHRSSVHLLQEGTPIGRACAAPAESLRTMPSESLCSFSYSIYRCQSLYTYRCPRGARRDKELLRDPPLKRFDGVLIEEANQAFLVAEEHCVFLERHEPPRADDPALNVDRFVAESHLRVAVLACVFHCCCLLNLLVVVGSARHPA